MDRSALILSHTLAALLVTAAIAVIASISRVNPRWHCVVKIARQ
jgi:hypothetical protein